MQKRTFVLMLALALVLPALYADIGENFAKGGIGLSGSISFYNNFYRVADSADERNLWSLDISPGFEYFIADRTALSLSPWFWYESDRADPDNIDRSMGVGFWAGGSYAFVPDPAAQRGLVFSIGGAIGLAFFPGVNDLQLGSEVIDDSLEVDLRLSLYPRLYFFLNDRLAPFIGLTPWLSYMVSLKNDAGATVDLTSRERFYARLTVTVGISYHIPNRNSSLLLRDRAQ